MPPRVELEAAPVKRGEALWTWDGTIARSGLLPMGRFPVRMLVAGYPLPHGKLGLVLIAPLEPTEKARARARARGARVARPSSAARRPKRARAAPTGRLRRPAPLLRQTAAAAAAAPIASGPTPPLFSPFQVVAWLQETGDVNFVVAPNKARLRRPLRRSSGGGGGRRCSLRRCRAGGPACSGAPPAKPAPLWLHCSPPAASPPPFRRSRPADQRAPSAPRPPQSPPAAPQQHWWWAPAAKAAFPGSLLVAPAELARERPELPVDVRVTAAGVQDLPGSWPADVIDVISVGDLIVLIVFRAVEGGGFLPRLLKASPRPRWVQ